MESITNNQSTYNENVVKAAFINHFAKHNKKNFVVCNELIISSKNKVVDLVFCKEQKSYAFEIKAWNDDFRRLNYQVDTYCKIFDYVYVVITHNHLKYISDIPSNVGVVLLSAKRCISYKRTAQKNKKHDSEELLSSIPLFFIRNILNDKKYTKSSNYLSLKQLRDLFIKYLHYRQRWSSRELSQSILHYEDITMNTEYVKL